MLMHLPVRMSHLPLAEAQKVWKGDPPSWCADSCWHIIQKDGADGCGVKAAHAHTIHLRAGAKPGTAILVSFRLGLEGSVFSRAEVESKREKKETLYSKRFGAAFLFYEKVSGNQRFNSDREGDFVDPLNTYALMTYMYFLILSA